MEKKKSSSKKKSDVNSTTSFPYTDLQKLCLDNEFNKTVICNVLSAEISAGQPWSTYYSPKTTEDEDIINIYIAYDNFDRTGDIRGVYIKNEDISETFLEILSAYFVKSNTISSIRFEYCNLTHEGIELLRIILRDCPQIYDLNLDGNPVVKPNYGCILEDTNLKYLSLKRCKINENGLRQVCENLCVFDRLIVLNLTGNYIDDNAVIHLAKMLRQNRSLRSINLADNWITDRGCFEIMKSLQNFTLTYDEIVIKRKINFEYYFTRLGLIKRYFQERDSNYDENGSVKNTAIINSLDFKSIYESLEKLRIIKNSTSSSTSKYSFSDNTSNGEKQFIIYIDENCPLPTHPFVNDIIEKDKEVHCTGNFHITSLNLAYNKLSNVGYKFISDALEYQLENSILGMGLTFIDLDGNPDQCSLEFFEIYRILMEKRLKSRKSSKSSMTRKSKNSI